MDRLIALGLGVFSVVYILGSWFLPRFQMTTVIDAWVFPFAVGVALLVLSILYWFQGNRTKPELPFKVKPALALTAALLIFAFVIEPLGFVVSTTLFLIAASAILGWRKWVSGISVAVGFSVVTYVLFDRLLSVPLPRGILPW